MSSVSVTEICRYQYRTGNGYHRAGFPADRWYDSWQRWNFRESCWHGTWIFYFPSGIYRRTEIQYAGIYAETGIFSKTFNPGTVNEKQAIRDLSLNLEKGDFATIIGSNGAGKSTLFNAICGDFLTDSGVIMLDGQDITFMPQHVRAKTIGRLYQDPMRGTAPGMTIEENLALAAGKGGWLSHVSRQEKERFHEELKLLDIGLEKRMTQPVGLLSGGQRQALTLLMATMNPPKLLLLDEHTAALDPGTAEKVLNLTKRIVEEHQLTCLMITHNMQSALDLGNRILMMDSGDIVLDIHEEEKKGLTVEGLLEKFKTGAGKMLDNDRILLSGEK